MTEFLTRLPAWLALRDHYRVASGFSLRELFASDPARFERFSFQCGDLLFDYSKNLATDETLRLLLDLARQRELPAWIERLFGGDKVNTTEDRAALHTALRAQEPVLLSGRNVVADVEDMLTKMERFCEEVWRGERRGSTGRPFSDIVNIGIGGSDLGPAFATEALAPYARLQPRLHFVSNVDGADLARVFSQVAPETTLFIVASKTFTTLETLANARSAKDWLGRKLGLTGVTRHLAAVTANRAAAREFGVAADAVFEFWDWVGGRYSLCSAVGLPIALSIGMNNFNALREGARQMDQHFRHTPLERNVPVLAGLIDVWYIDFFNAAARAVLPYDHRLKRLPEYLQQLEMESNGKSVTRDGLAIDYATAPIVFGTVGTNGQHAYYQLLHQGTRVVPAEFIACCRSRHELAGHHAMLIANFFAQTEALACGKTPAEAEAEMRARGIPETRIAELLPHRVFAGNQPSTSILLKELDPRALGALVAFYEHKTFVQSVIWNINAFDQWGVELGKQLAERLLRELEGDTPVSSHDASTNGLINYFKAHRQ